VETRVPASVQSAGVSMLVGTRVSAYCLI
jgi:hypothetical protein